MVRFIGLPQIGDGVRSLMDFAPLAAGLQNYNQGKEVAQQQSNMTQLGTTYANQGAGAAGKQALSLGEVDAGLQFNRQAQADKDRQIKVLGAGADAVLYEKDPNRKAAIWNAVLKRAGVNPADLDPEELDPITGPQAFKALSGNAQDPRESQLMDLKLKGAQLDIANAQRAKTPSAPKIEQIFDDQGRPRNVVWDGTKYVPIGGAGPAKPEKMSPGQQVLDKEFAKEYNDLIVQGGAADAKKNIGAVRDVVKQLNDPKGANLSGGGFAFIPDVVQDVVFQKSAAARQNIEEVVQRNLRIILGAQFTNEEGKRLIARAYNVNQPEEENAKRLTRLLTAMDTMLNAKMKAAEYFQKNGTLQGYDGVANFRATDIEAAIDGGASSPNAMDLGDGFTVEVQQ